MSMELEYSPWFKIEEYGARNMKGRNTRKLNVTTFLLIISPLKKLSTKVRLNFTSSTEILLPTGTLHVSSINIDNYH